MEINNDFTPDGIPTIEKQLKDIEESEKNFLNTLRVDCPAITHKKNMLMRVKFLGLYKMNKDPFMGSSSLTSFDRKILQKEMSKYNDIPEADIIKEYNEICGELLSDSKTNYTQFMVSYH